MRYHEWGADSEGGPLWKGLVAGTVVGLVASYAMSRAQSLWSMLGERLSSSGGDAGQQGSSDRPTDEFAGGKQQEGSEGSGPEQHREEQEPATVKAASVIAEGVFNHRLSESEKETAGLAVHYAFGTTVGSLYGVLAERVPAVTVGAGLTFGTAVWLIADEGAVPTLGLSSAPWEYPASTHLYALAAHLVYGLTAEVVRRLVRRVL